MCVCVSVSVQMCTCERVSVQRKEEQSAPVSMKRHQFVSFLSDFKHNMVPFEDELKVKKKMTKPKNEKENKFSCRFSKKSSRDKRVEDVRCRIVNELDRYSMSINDTENN